jgi:group I intron endonuclease
MKTYIYTLSDNSGIRYVGKSDNPEARLTNHLKECKMQRTHKEKWILSLKESGKTPILEILDEINYKEWPFFESYWISQLKSWGFNLVNGTSGGEGSDGFRGKKHSEESRNKISKNLKGKPGTSRKGVKMKSNVLNEDMVKEIKILLRDTNLSHSKIASMYENVSKLSITRINLNKRWTHVKI